MEYNFLNDWGMLSFGSSTTGQSTPKRDMVVYNGNVGIGTTSPISRLTVA